MNPSGLTKLEAAIGYHFNDPGLLELAMTHSSYANEHKTRSNERIEFLGDAVLELVSSEYMYMHFPKLPEGELTRLRASFVCENALFETSERIGLRNYILLGKGEEATGGRNRASVVSDAFESLIGAVYLDGGFANAKELILKFILNDLDSRFFFDSKTMLQEVLQSEGLSDPEYVVVRESGPDHDKRYTVQVKSGDKVLGEGTDTSKKRAAQAGAMEALKKLGKV
ncbi:MAG: ribonuclease III [Lachnospiraceae bacterium]|nr:ribonuclease III [Candidatus Darwinimomas equi]